MSGHTDATRLGADTLHVLAVRGVDVPGYDRSALVPHIVRIGVGVS
jgi:hypothetical protein